MVKDELTEIQESLSALQQRLDLLISDGKAQDHSAEEAVMEPPMSLQVGDVLTDEEISRLTPAADGSQDAVVGERAEEQTASAATGLPAQEALAPGAEELVAGGPSPGGHLTNPTAEPAAGDQMQPEAPARNQTNTNSVSSFDRNLMATLRAGMAELAAARDIKEIPRFFARLANRTGLRLVVLKRWRTGMQVYHTEGIKMPEEARKKRADGKAPIPVQDDDVFMATGQEHVVYAGPVPVKRFPLDLTLMLGRGSKNRQIVILPVPVRDHWNTFLYLDADYGTERALAVVEILAQYALARMSLLRNGEIVQGSKTAAILKQELRRRQDSQARQVQTTAIPVDAQAGPAPEVAKPELNGQDPLSTPVSASAAMPAASPATKAAPSPTPVATPGRSETFSFMNPAADQSTGQAGVGTAAMADIDHGPIVVDSKPEPAPTAAQKLDCGWTPETILQHSGELPALPRAASHILAVIENPRTTATKLEKAIALDQALTAKVLRIANSPFYGAVRDIKTVSEAVIRLGFVTIRNWTLVAATKSVFLTPGAGLLFQKIWRQSVLSAMASQLVGQKLRDQEPESVFLGGLMQNIGQLVLARAETELFHEIVERSASRQVPYHVIEREMLGFDHGELGAILIREWNLSRDLEEAVRFHHRLDEVELRNRLPAMIALGEEIAHCSGSGPEQDEVHWESSEAARFLDVSAEVYAELREQARLLSIDPQFFA